MSMFVVCHTNIKDIQELDRRLEAIQEQYASVLKKTCDFSNARLSDPWDTEILQEEGVDFQSVTNFSFSEKRGSDDYWPDNAVEILKKEFSDVEFIAMFQNESLL